MYVSLSGKYAIYQNREFKLEEHDDSFWLTSKDHNDMALGLSPVKVNPDRLIKKGFLLEDLSFAYSKETYVVYDGIEYEAVGIQDDKIILLCFYNSELLKKYRDSAKRMVEFYEVSVPLKDITKITQVWKPLKIFVCQKSSHEKRSPD